MPPALSPCQLPCSGPFPGTCSWVLGASQAWCVDAGGPDSASGPDSYGVSTVSGSASGITALGPGPHEGTALLLAGRCRQLRGGLPGVAPISVPPICGVMSHMRETEGVLSAPRWPPTWSQGCWGLKGLRVCL